MQLLREDTTGTVPRKLNFVLPCLFSLLWLVLSTTAAQAQEIDWATRIGGNGHVYAEYMAVDSDNNLYITGAFENSATFGSATIASAGSSDLYLAKFDAAGNAIWVRQFGGVESDSAGGVAADGNGNSYIFGHFQATITIGSITFTNEDTHNDGLIAKVDTNGNVIWAAQIVGSGGNVLGQRIAIDDGGNLYVAGVFEGTAEIGTETLTSVDQLDTFVTKYDANGNPLWVNHIGGSQTQWAFGLAQYDGNVYVSGRFQATTTVGTTTLTSAGFTDIFLVAYDSNGTPLWARRDGGTENDSAEDMVVDSQGNIILTGIVEGTAEFAPLTATSAGDLDGFIAKYNREGTPIWVETFGGPWWDFALRIAVDSADNLYVTGDVTASEAYFGSIRAWQQGGDTFVASYDSHGQALWVRQAARVIAFMQTRGIVVDSDGFVSITGSYNTTAIFGHITLTADGPETEAFLARWTPGPTSDLIFSDSFESGDFSAWTNYSSDLGDLSVTPAAALVGALGLTVLLDDEITIGTRDEAPERERSYRARFYLDPNSLTMAQDENHVIFFAYSGDDLRRPVLRLELRKRDNVFQLRAALFDDDSTWRVSRWVDISDAPHLIELAWNAAVAAGENNGRLDLWLDNVVTASLTGVDNDTRRIDTTRLGAIAGIDPGTRGVYFFDAFESRRLTNIGAEEAVSVAMAAPPVIAAPAEIAAWEEHDESEPEEAALMQEVLEYAEQVEREEAQEESPPSEEEQSPQLFLPYLNNE